MVHLSSMQPSTLMVIRATSSQRRRKSVGKSGQPMTVVACSVQGTPACQLSQPSVSLAPAAPHAEVLTQLSNSTSTETGRRTCT